MSDILCPYEIYDQTGQSAHGSHPLLPDRPDVGGMLGEAGHLRTQHTAANSPTTRRLPLLPIPHGDTDTEQPPPSTTATPTVSDPSTPPTHGADDVTPSTSPAEDGTLTNTQGRDLTRGDLFNPPLSLKEDLYNVATIKKKKGIGARLRDSDGVEAELRLENRFRKLTFNAGQDNNSESSDLTLRVEVYRDGKSDQFIDIPFNEIKPFEIDVTNTNALKIDLIPLDREGHKYNGSRSLTAVMFDMRLE